jgi:hypothetical protein
MDNTQDDRPDPNPLGHVGYTCAKTGLPILSATVFRDPEFREMTEVVVLSPGGEIGRGFYVGPGFVGEVNVSDEIEAGHEIKLVLTAFYENDAYESLGYSERDPGEGVLHTETFVQTMFWMARNALIDTHEYQTRYEQFDTLVSEGNEAANRLIFDLDDPQTTEAELEEAWSEVGDLYDQFLQAEDAQDMTMTCGRFEVLVAPHLRADLAKLPPVVVIGAMAMIDEMIIEHSQREVLRAWHERRRERAVNWDAMFGLVPWFMLPKY